MGPAGLRAADGQRDGALGESGAVGADEGEVAAAAGAGHFPGEDAGEGRVAVDVVLDAGLDHCREEGDLGLEGGAVGGGEGGEVAGEDGGPAGVGGGGEGADLRLGERLAFDDGAAGAAGEHRDHTEMVFEPREHGFVVARLDLEGPETVVVVVAAEAGTADADGVLGAGDDAVAALGIVLEAEHELGEHLGIHIRQPVGPDLPDLIARGGRETAALTDFERGLERDGDGPAGGVARHVRLVDPGAGQIEPRGDLAGRGLQLRRAARREPRVGHALQLDVLHPPLLAQPPLLFASPVGIHHQDIGLNDVERREKIEDAAAGVDVGVFHIADALDHKEPLLLAVHRAMVLVAENRGIGTDAHVEVAVRRRLAEELHVAGVEQIVATRYKDFLRHSFGDCSRSTAPRRNRNKAQ